MTEEERKMYRLQQTGGSYLQELRERKARIQTPEVSEKLDRLELLLSRILYVSGNIRRTFPRQTGCWNIIFRR